MRQILRVALVVLLAAVLGVGSAWGDGQYYTDGNGVTWKCYLVGMSDVCSIAIPESNRGSISGFVEIPKRVEVELAYRVALEVVSIAPYAFKDCIGLTGVTIPGSVEVIAWEAFSGCRGLKEVTIPGSVTEIGKEAFSGCRGLRAVTIPGSVTKIGWGAFSGCSGLKSIGVESGNKNYCAAGGVLFTKDKATLVCYPGGKPKESYIIPSSVTEIGGGAFGGCSGLREITIPSSVKTINKNAFIDCKGLEAVTISDGVTEIGRRVFSGCSGLNAVYWFAKANCRVEDEAFDGIASPATLYVRKGKKTEIESKSWCKFTNVVEGYVVTFNANGGTPASDVKIVEEGKTATAPTGLTKDGYTLVEWQLNGGKYDFSTPVTQDITLVAVWKKKEESTPDNSETAVESVRLAGVRVVRNPVGEALELEGMERAARVEVYSVCGARVHAEALRGAPRVVIDAQGWASGVYVVRVEASDGARTLRVVK